MVQLLRNYTNTKCELELAKTRLNLLMDKKEALYCKYFPISPTLKETVVDGGIKNNDKMTGYIYELTKIDDITGKSLEDEINEQRNDVGKINYYVSLMEYTIQKLTGIEYELYRDIVFNGKNITKAVEKIAEKNGKEPQTIWKNYYPKIKNDIKKLKIYNI